jgi:hypothetical protein
VAKSSKDPQLESMEEIKRLLILGLSNQGIEGKRIAEVLDVDPAVISRIATKGSSMMFRQRYRRK